jgi:hypothetical protein
MKSRAALVATVVTMALLAGGCYRTRFDLTPPMAEGTSELYDNHFHVSLINVIEISDPIDLTSACAGGKATAIEEKIGVAAAFVNAFLGYFPIVHFTNARVKCGMQGSPTTAPAR